MTPILVLLLAILGVVLGAANEQVEKIKSFLPAELRNKPATKRFAPSAHHSIKAFKKSGLAKYEVQHLTDAHKIAAIDSNTPPSGYLQLQMHADFECSPESVLNDYVVPLGVCVVNWLGIVPIRSLRQEDSNFVLGDLQNQEESPFLVLSPYAGAAQGFFRYTATGYFEKDCQEHVPGSTITGSWPLGCDQGASLSFHNKRPSHDFGYLVKVFAGDNCLGSHGYGQWYADLACIPNDWDDNYSTSPDANMSEGFTFPMIASGSQTCSGCTMDLFAGMYRNCPYPYTFGGSSYSFEGCQLSCQYIDSCNFFTYYADAQACELHFEPQCNLFSPENGGAYGVVYAKEMAQPMANTFFNEVLQPDLADDHDDEGVQFDCYSGYGFHYSDVWCCGAPDNVVALSLGYCLNIDNNRSSPPVDQHNQNQVASMGNRGVHATGYSYIGQCVGTRPMDGMMSKKLRVAKKN